MASTDPRTSAPADPTQTTYTRSALPIAISWFVIPALILVVSEALRWWV
ncbi:MAG TPA: hypothetical protein PLQ13_06635 [Candidatus Krumholzibacteria bacterium]|nr:hypothetical protein [Candidatus Krumholzibacteria bacterium]